jgi:hypothetical protein
MYSTLKETYAQKKIDKVCIFDIDNTLTHGVDANSNTCPGVQFHNDPGPSWPKVGSGSTNDIKAVVQKCRDQGYGLAIATAESENEAINPTQFAFLKDINPAFDEQFLTSDRFQRACSVVDPPYCITNEYANKTGMYENIMNSYGIPPDQWGNSVVFDDDMNNLTTARGMGFRVCQASPECGGKYCTKGCGVRKDCFNVLDK